jgi:adenylate cyclase
VVHTDESNRFLINYYGPAGSFPYYSFIDVLEGKISPSIFKDKIVFIGWKAAGIGDFWVTPTSPALPGVEKQATIISNILHQDFIIRDKYLVIWDLALILITGLTLGLLIPKLSPLRAASFSLLLCVLLGAFIQYTFSHAKLWIYAVYPFLTIGLAYSSTTVFRLLTEEREKRKIRNTFSLYLSPVVVDQLVKHPGALKLGGERRILTVFFSDIRGFTTLSEGMPVEDLVTLLNRYMDAMTEIILDHEGLLDKYIGDAILAVYGAPIPQNDHAMRACLTALDMMERLRQLHQEWEKEQLPCFDIGIGINTGPVAIGNMGSEKRFTYTVIGDGVNLTARLEGLNKKYGTHILISESTYLEVKDCMICQDIGAVEVRGKKEPVKIYELLGEKGA